MVVGAGCVYLMRRNWEQQNHESCQNMREKPEKRERGVGGAGEGQGTSQMKKACLVLFKAYPLLGPPKSWNNRLTPTSPAPDGMPYNGKNHAVLSNGCYTFSLQGAQQLITPTNPRSHCDCSERRSHKRSPGGGCYTVAALQRSLQARRYT